MTDRTNIYFDFEFIDDGREIVPISLGMCVADPYGQGEEMEVPGKWLYIEYAFDPARADDWVRENVFPNLEHNPFDHTNPGARTPAPRNYASSLIRRWVSRACGDTKPQFWGHGPAYDWVCLVQHFGTKEQLPKGWPIRPRCLEQLAEHLGIAKEAFPKQPEDAHNALANAKWNRSLHEYLKIRDD